MLRINREEFKELYPDIDYYYIFTRDPKSDEEFLADFLSSKLWRMNNLYNIVDKDGNNIGFNMNKAQHKVYAAARLHPRLIILKSRQQGISTLWLLSFFDDALFETDFNIGLMAQGKDEAKTLLKRVKHAWDELDIDIKTFLILILAKDNAGEISFNNKSTIFIRTSFRSTTLQRLHISEFGKIANKYPERAKETYTGTLQALAPGNTGVLESTAEGDNKFKEVWDTAELLLASGQRLSPKDFYPIFLSWLDDPDCSSDINQPATAEQQDYFEKAEEELAITINLKQRNFWIIQYRELGEDIYQEYPMTPEEAFTIARDGTYYAHLFRNYVTKKKRKLKDLYDHNLLVDVVFDLGMNDTFVLGYFQTYGIEERQINEYFNTGEGLEHYVEHIRSTGYKIGRVYVPHDVKVKELSTGMSRLHRLRELGVTNITVLPRVGVNDGIEAVRTMLKNFYIDAVMCPYTIKCYMNYQKEWDDHHANWKDKPLHNKWSHGADMSRYRAVSKRGYRIKKENDQTKSPSTTVTDGLCI